MRSAGALAVLLGTVLPLAGGSGLPWLLGALEGEPEPHVCVCPIGADGECECPECIRLHVHDRAASVLHETYGLSIRPSCADGEAEQALRSVLAIAADAAAPVSSPRVHVRRPKLCDSPPRDADRERIERPPRLARSAR
jgi:hypothetical protein